MNSVFTIRAPSVQHRYNIQGRRRRKDRESTPSVRSSEESSQYCSDLSRDFLDVILEVLRNALRGRLEIALLHVVGEQHNAVPIRHGHRGLERLARAREPAEHQHLGDAFALAFLLRRVRLQQGVRGLLAVGRTRTGACFFSNAADSACPKSVGSTNNTALRGIDSAETTWRHQHRHHPHCTPSHRHLHSVSRRAVSAARRVGLPIHTLICVVRRENGSPASSGVPGGRKTCASSTTASYKADSLGAESCLTDRPSAARYPTRAP